MLFSQAKRTGRKSDFDKLMRNRVISYLRRAKSNFFRNINPGNAKKFWSAIKHLNKANNSIPVLSHGNVSARSSQEKAEMLNTFFSTCFNQAVPPLLSDQSSPSGLSGTACDDLLCTPDEVHFYVSSLDPNKATGPDGISARMLRQTADSITTSVTELLNLSLRSGCVPKEWKKSNVVPIPKTSPPSTPSNYRPISLLRILSKVMERHFHLLITEHLRDCHPLSDSQWGFQAGKSTVTGLLATLHSWLNILEKTQEVGAVFFDLRKAFDSVPHATLMAKLQQIGLNDHILTWIGDYLTAESRESQLVGQYPNTQ